MPKKRPADERGGTRARASKLPRRQRNHHLYLVLDDWEKGYSIRKFDLSSDSDSDDDGDHCPAASSLTERRLPPSVFRLEAPHAHSGLFAAFGTKILATHHTPRRSALMFDVRTRALTFGPRHRYEPNCYGNAYVEVDGNLFVLDVDGNFEMLEPPPPTPSDEHANVEIVWKWEKLPEPPFFDNIFSHAVHPDERTIFFSTERETEKLTTKVATFSFDTVSWKWTRRGDWLLPFKGRGYFDPELDAWIGLSGDPDNLGYLCACEIVPADDESNGKPQLLKVGKDKMFCVDPAEKHIGASLVYMGGRSKFCLVECLSIDDRREEFWGEFLSERLRYFLRVTTFFLKYDKNGDLRTSVHHQRVRSYRLPKIATDYCDHLEKPVAFWM